MKKIILSICLLALVTLGAGIYYLYAHLDNVVKVAIEKFGSEAMQTTVRVDKVRVAPTEGAASIYGLTIANPENFSAPHVFSLGEISTRIDFKNSNTDKIVIDEITILAPQIFYEMNQTHKTNLSGLQKNVSVSDAVSSSPETSGTSSKRSGPKLMIRKIKFAEGNIKMMLAPLNKEYSLTLPAIQMVDLGGPHGVHGPEIVRQIMETLLDRAYTEIKGNSTDIEIEKIKQQLNAQKELLGNKNNQNLDSKKKALLEKIKNSSHR